MMRDPSMKATLMASGVVILALGSFTFGATASERTHGPCFNVQIQHERINQSNVRQDCDINVSRTVQVGQQNESNTQQRGARNDNKVRQTQYDHPAFSTSTRGAYSTGRNYR